MARDPAQRRHGVRDVHALREDGPQRGEHYRAFHVDRDIGTAAVGQRDKSLAIAVGVEVSVKAEPSFGHVDGRDPAGEYCSCGRPELPASRSPERGGAGAYDEADDRAALYSARAGAERNSGSDGLEDLDSGVGRRVPAITAIRSQPDLIRTSFGAFGTFGVLLITRQAALSRARQILAAELAAIDVACSRFRPDSELTRINAASGSKQPVSALLAEAIRVALRAAEATDGDVDPTCGASLVRLGYDRDFALLAADSSRLTRPAVPAGGWRSVNLDLSARTVQVPEGVLLDLGATAKALAADRAASAIAAATSAGVLVNLGGDIAVAGPPPPSGWRVAIDDGVHDHGPVVAIRDGGLATSGPAARSWRRGDRRLHHILVPRTGLPASTCWAAATVAAASCTDANTASTAAVIRSAAALPWLESLALPARLVGDSGTVVTTPGWPDEF